MKIIIANKYYYLRGGSEIYSIGLERLLLENGHDVAFFSMEHPLNIKSDLSHYFPRNVDLNKLNPLTMFPAIVSPFGSLMVRRNFSRLLRSFKPDIVHLNNIHTQLSPILAIIAHKYRIPVVWTIHDHKFLCPRYDCMRKGQPCELCFSDKFNVVKFKCVKDSLSASLLAWAEALAWNRKRLSRSSDLFICPSNFLANNLKKGGFNPDKLKVLPNFVDVSRLDSVKSRKSEYYCYVGRLSSEKGIETLMQAAVELPQNVLKVIGTGPMEQSLKEKYTAKNIEFLGYKKWDELRTVLENSKCMVIPSECYENSPLSAIESLCLGTPVLGSRIGGIPELINTGVNGYTFKPGDKDDLKRQLITLLSDSHTMDYTEIAKNARLKFSSLKYYNDIIELYGNLQK